MNYISNDRRLSRQEVHDLLNEMNNQFTPPPLLQEVDILQYSEKLSKYAHFCVTRTLEGVIAYYVNPGPRTAYIPLVWVDESMRQRGIATALFEALHRHLSDYNSISLEVRKDNESAFRLYSNMGYVITEDRGLKYLMTKMIKG